MNLLPGVRGSVYLSADELFRYRLRRDWYAATEKPRTVVWIMLNPSTADELTDDQTIRKCQGFTQRWGYNGLAVVNLFAYRSKDPVDLLQSGLSPVGSLNDVMINNTIFETGVELVVAAWGNHGSLMHRDEEVTRRLRLHDVTLMRLGPATKGGHPRHPGRIGYDTPLEVHA